MKKIMFNDKYGLTEAVLSGRKTMTRRLVPCIACNSVLPAMKYNGLTSYYDFVQENHRHFDVGEEVAIAQPYQSIIAAITPTFGSPHTYDHLRDEAGWNNKMFVAADLMPHRIRITGIKVERLQDISDEDCIKEGIVPTGHANFPYTFNGAPLWKVIPVTCYDRHVWYRTARQAFSVLIDKICKRGTWQKNPFVLAYSFDLVR